MKKFIVLAVISFIFASCSQKSDPIATSRNADESSSSGIISSSNVAEFPDIPIPEGALMDSELTIVMGADDAWTGRLIFTVPYSANAVFEFYLSEMPTFGWTEVTVVRAGVNQMIYQQGIRIANIQISNDGSNKSKILFMMSPPSKKSSTKHPSSTIKKSSFSR